MTILDPRLTPMRPDLAAMNLRGLVDAERFVEGRRFQVAAPVLDLKRAPRSDAALDTQLLHGEILRVFDEKDGWAWVQAERDDYVGYVASHGLSAEIRTPTHQVVTRRTFLYPAPDLKRPILKALPLGARIAICDEDDAFARLQDGGFVYRAHLVPIDRKATHDVVAIAEDLIGTPYLWGGCTPNGIDCSGLVQLSFAMAGVALPRDTQMQQNCGEALPFNEASIGLRRGDLIFWRGHVGVMRDEKTLLHANAHHMLVYSEILAVARDRIATNSSGGDILAVRRLSKIC